MEIVLGLSPCPDVDAGMVDEYGSIPVGAVACPCPVARTDGNCFGGILCGSSLPPLPVRMEIVLVAFSVACPCPVARTDGNCVGVISPPRYGCRDGGWGVLPVGAVARPCPDARTDGDRGKDKPGQGQAVAPTNSKPDFQL